MTLGSRPFLNYKTLKLVKHEGSILSRSRPFLNYKTLKPSRNASVNVRVQDLF